MQMLPHELNGSFRRRIDLIGNGKQPSDYAIDSPQSRAAARAILDRRFAARKKISIIFHEDEHGFEYEEPEIERWREGPDGSLLRRCFLPPGMSTQEAVRIVSQTGWTPKPRRGSPELPHPVPEF